MSTTLKTAFIMASLLLAACAPTAKETYLPDGSQGHKIDCSGEGGNMGSCLQKAGETCGAAGYTVLDKGENLAKGSTFSFPKPPAFALADYISNANNQRYMIIKCKE